MTFIDGKTQETGGRFDDSIGSDEPIRMGEFRGCSSINGLQQGRPVKDGCSGQDSTRTNAFKSNSTTGKILQRLKLIESKYSSYVQNNEKQLEALLGESRNHKLELAQDIADLEQEIYDLVSTEEPQEPE